jgi:glutamine---fructose-6-phosphate transaminase (isomerizing)
MILTYRVKLLTSKVSERVTSHLEREIRAQGAAIARREAQGRLEARAAAELLRRDDVDYLVAVARGSSDNAARYAQYLLGTEAGVTVALAAPWLFGPGHDPPRLARAAVLAISQSGQSPDVAAVLAAARDQNRPTIAITNDPASPLTEHADVVVELGVGPELSVAATTTYTASLHALVQITAALRPRREWREWLGRIAETVTEMVDVLLRSRQRFDPVAGLGLLTVVGRGLDYATAFETALKIRELSGTPAEAYSPPDLVHGPVAAVDHRTALWAASSATETSAETRDVLRAVGSRAGLTVAVSADPTVLALADIRVALPQALPAWAAAIIAVLPAQAAALRLAELGEVDLDAPHGLRKVTTTL